MSLRFSHHAAGYLSVVGATLLWASSGVAGKALFTAGMPPLALVQLRVTLAGALLFLVFLARAPGLLRVRAKDLLYFAALGSGAMALAQASYFHAISKIPLAAAILLQYTAPLWVAGFAFWALGETLSSWQSLGGALVIGAVILLNLSGEGADLSPATVRGRNTPSG